MNIPAGESTGRDVATGRSATENNTRSDNLISRLFEVFEMQGELRKDQDRLIPVPRTERDRLIPRLSSLSPEALTALIEYAERVPFGIDELESVITEYAKREQRELLMNADVAVEPIDTLALLGEIDTSLLDEGEDPEPNPYLHGLVPLVGMQLIAGQGGVGKTWITLEACRQAAEASDWAPGAAVYLDLDCNGVRALGGRLRQLGMPDEAIRRRAVNIVVPSEIASLLRRPTWEVVRGVIKSLEIAPPRLIVLDSFAKAIAASEGSENDASDCNKVLGELEYLRTVSSVVVIDHIGHEATQRPRGAAAKIDTPDSVIMVAGAPTVEGSVEVITSMEVTAVKDRHGNLKHLAAPGDTSGNATLGSLTVVKSSPLSVRFTSARQLEANSERMEAVSKALGTDPDTRRRKETVALLAAAGADGLSQTQLAAKLYEALKDDEDLRLGRDKMRAFVDEYLSEMVAEASVMTKPNRSGVNYVLKTVLTPEDPFEGSPLPDIAQLAQQPAQPRESAVETPVAKVSLNSGVDLFAAPDPFDPEADPEAAERRRVALANGELSR